MLIDLKNVSLKYAKRDILSNISLEVCNDQIITLVGPNGGGKTSLARLILGIIDVDSGKITRKKGMRMSYMPQKIYLSRDFPFSVEEFLSLKNTQKTKNDQERILSFLERLGVKDLLKKQFHDLSGGQQQKISFLRAISSDYDLLVLDEPTQFMDLSATNEFYLIIEELRNSNHSAILLISHDLNLVMNKTDMVYCVNRHICCRGHVKQIDKSPEFIKFLRSIENTKNQSLNNYNSIHNNFSIYQHHHDHHH